MDSKATKNAVVESCYVKSMYGTLTLSDNPDCGFVKGGE